MLGLFIALVAICGLFFGFGYSLGRGSAKQTGSLISENTPAGTATTNGSKPGASQTGAQPASGTTPDNLTFYKAVEQKDANTELTPAEKPADQQSAPFQQAQPEMAQKPQSNAPATSAANIGTGYMVQIAAVSKKEDADLLRSALQQKQYPVVIVSTPSDKLFHVQVGPFAELKDAEQMKTRLVSDGYNPIVKR